MASYGAILHTQNPNCKISLSIKIKGSDSTVKQLIQVMNANKSALMLLHSINVTVRAKSRTAINIAINGV